MPFKDQAQFFSQVSQAHISVTLRSPQEFIIPTIDSQ